MKHQSSWSGGLKSAPARQAKSATAKNKFYTNRIGASIALLVGGGVAVGFAPLLPGMAMISLVILGWAMTAAAFGTFGRLLYLDWKDAVPTRDTASKLASPKKYQTRIEMMSPANRFSSNDNAENACAAGPKPDEGLVGGLAFVETVPKDLDTLMREAVAEQERLGSPARAVAPRRYYIPLPHL
jgi:hypothetical protein